MFSPPTFSPSDNSTHMISPSDSWTLELFDPHLLVPVSFSSWIFCPSLGEKKGGLIVTCDSWSNLLWQLVHPLCEVNWVQLSQGPCWKRLGLNRLMTPWESRKLEKLLIFFVNSAVFHAFFRKYIGPTVTVYVGKSSSGSTVTLWQSVLDFGVQMFVFRVDEQFVHFWLLAWTICH
jgi:hypothetical protein